MPLDLHTFSPSCSLRFRSLSGFEEYHTTNALWKGSSSLVQRNDKNSEIHAQHGAQLRNHVTVLTSMNSANPYQKWLLLAPEPLLLWLLWLV